jgi:energy-converting hydrogenase Eha subunit F
MKFTTKNIGDFSTLTGDTDYLHNLEDMRKKGKQIVVPGKMTFCVSANDALVKHPKTNMFIVYFGEMLYPEEEISIENTDLELIVKRDGVNLLESGENKSKFGHVDPKKSEISKYLTSSFYYTNKDIEKFSSLINSHKSYSELLYAISNTSRHLINASANPSKQFGQKTVERLKKMKDENELPVYQKLGIYILSNELVQTQALIYQISIKATGKRNLSADIVCLQQEHHIFQAKYQCKIMSQKLVEKMIRDI